MAVGEEFWHGSVGGDAAQFVRDAWWVQERVFGLHNRWWTSLLYAPEGTYLTAHPLETLSMVIVSPVTALAGPVVTYGLRVIALAAAGVLAWCLGRTMGLGPVGSWAAGILWASSPIVVHRTASGWVRANATRRIEGGSLGRRCWSLTAVRL